jgi:hypothetical protein
MRIEKEGPKQPTAYKIDSRKKEKKSSPLYVFCGGEMNVE